MEREIQLRGIGVHNLKGVDLDLPLGELIVFCGVSGSGKTSLAIDTLYAEGQRRYIESFSTYTRQFLDRPEKPDAERIDGIPAAIAVTRGHATRSPRSTVGTTTEIADFLRVIYAKIGEPSCHQCGRPVSSDSPQSIASAIQSRAATRAMVGFDQSVADNPQYDLQELREQGFVRVVDGGRTVNLTEAGDWAELLDSLDGRDGSQFLFVIVDRITASVDATRLRDSLETCLQRGHQRCRVLLSDGGEDGDSQVEVDGRLWHDVQFSAALECSHCRLQYPDPEPRLFSFNSPLGACSSCEGSGVTIDFDIELAVPDQSKSIRNAAVIAWSTPGFEDRQRALLTACKQRSIPLDVAVADMDDAQQGALFQLVRAGLDELAAGKQTAKVRSLLSRCRSSRACQSCSGTRLRPEALSFRVGGLDVAELSRLPIGACQDHLGKLKLGQRQQEMAEYALDQVARRLSFLVDVGVGYLSLDRPLTSLSSGETQRVALTSALASSLVNMLYVLDEPTVGLHPQDVERLSNSIRELRDRQNTVVVVEHEEEIIRRADQIVEVGPGAGERGGEIVFQGSCDELLQSEESLTADYLCGRRGISIPNRRPAERGRITIKGARGNNLKNITVQFPLGLLCVVTGVSGAGKSTLVQETLYGALCHRMRKDGPKPHPFDEIFGDGQLDDVVLVDQAPIGRSPRSNPVTYIKAFDQIRAVFAETIDARTHNYGASQFSFNVAGGRCDQCEGEGFKRVDMQFLPDVFRKCSACDGTRYRREILEVTYRGRNIAQVLQMTVRESFSFFRGQTKVQTKLKSLLDVGLDYLRLGQPANTLSAGEAQRLKLASYLGSQSRNRTLFILDEPTTGLHFADIVKLQDCFESLLSVGHSLLLVEHNLQLIRAADYLIDLGPGAAADGGDVVAVGTPEEVAQNPRSVTGRWLQP